MLTDLEAGTHTILIILTCPTKQYTLFSKTTNATSHQINKDTNYHHIIDIPENISV
jgi:hypothetical protein